MDYTTQMLKGVLEGCILKIVNNRGTYGYEICERLTAYGFQEVSEGSVNLAINDHLSSVREYHT